MPLTTDAVHRMDYNQLIGLVRETNRPPGGERSVLRVAQAALVGPRSSVLEIGTSTGFTAIELARLTGCRVTAIDINEQSLTEGRARALAAGVGELTNFEEQDATQLTYSDGQFDMVFCGNVTSLIANRSAALAEYARVLRPRGFLAAIPMYYIDRPSAALVRRVSAAIHVNITPYFRSDWVRFFDQQPFELFWSEDFRFDRVDDATMDDFIVEILDRPHLKELPADVGAAVAAKYREYMYLFRDNLSHMGYTLMLLRKTPADVDRELFTSRRVTP